MSIDLPVGSRILVVGVSGSGKSRAASRLAQLLDYPLIELDAIHWLSDWQEMPRPQIRLKVAELIKNPTWVIDGNYSYLRDITWANADTLIWLNYRLPLILWRLTKRTYHRLTTREILWNGNVENLRSAFVGRESLFRWALHSYAVHRRNYPLALEDPRYAHLRVYRFRSPVQFEKLISQIAASKM